MYAAANRDHNSMVRFLIDSGADVNAPGLYGTALHAAVNEGHEGVAVTILESGADVNATSETYPTVLHIAALMGDLKIANFVVGTRGKYNSGQRGMDEGKCNRGGSSESRQGND